MSEAVRIVEGREVHPGDVLVSAQGSGFTVTKTKRVGRGIRVFYERPDGGAAYITVAPDSKARVARVRGIIGE
ncbi:hypothetical protein MN032_05255 [Agromyces atrinae]|uniref:DUF1918 domain-containing protein n=1 Tax=Agromyces atrinae TaxID=592376 RepID=A0A4Q2M7L7_9MICO|nr:hypothetical protein [Agromyces atrinae]MCI2957092.1 hypothetical protein [Agromyces atrinae]NYD67540.1 hypothetical protein [Agromyces atrinae]RXZ88245.1 hypothetical protein ESP50_03435 [Agromyces atrinae]